MSLIKQLVLLSALVSLAAGQTLVDLRTQGKDVNFTAASATLPLKTGTTLPATCVPAELFFKIDAPAGANVFGCTSTNTWVVESGGGGAAAQNSILSVTRTNGQTLSIGSGCTTSNPCPVRFGNTTYSIQTGATATISAGSGLAFVYISSAGVITVGHNLTVSCSGCTAQSGLSGFPPNSIPLFTWSATSGAWDATGGVDFRASLSTKSVVAGLGLLGTDTLGIGALSVDPTMVAMRTAVPANSSSTCSVGNWAVNSTFFYVCVGPNTWARVGVVSW